jgi:hypothetical protein
MADLALARHVRNANMLVNAEEIEEDHLIEIRKTAEDETEKIISIFSA